MEKEMKLQSDNSIERNIGRKVTCQVEVEGRIVATQYGGGNGEDYVVAAGSGWWRVSPEDVTFLDEQKEDNQPIMQQVNCCYNCLFATGKLSDTQLIKCLFHASVDDEPVEDRPMSKLTIGYRYSKYDKKCQFHKRRD